MGQLLLFLVVGLTVAAVVFGVTVLIGGGDPGLAPAEPDGRAVPLPGNRPLVESDLADVRFDTTVRGYRMVQVDQALRRAAYDIGYKDELIGVLEAEVIALREGRTADADVLRGAREAALAPARPAPAGGAADTPGPLADRPGGRDPLAAGAEAPPAPGPDGQEAHGQESAGRESAHGYGPPREQPAATPTTEGRSASAAPGAQSASTPPGEQPAATPTTEGRPALEAPRGRPGEGRSGPHAGIGIGPPAGTDVGSPRDGDGDAGGPRGGDDAAPAGPDRDLAGRPARLGGAAVPSEHG